MPVIRTVPGEEFQRVANALRLIDKTLPGDFRKALKEAVKETVKEVKATIRTAPLRKKTVRNKGLRRRLARGVSVQVAVGRNPRMRIITKMPPGQEMLPRGTDKPTHGPHKGWRHPVFGRRNQPWVIQKTGHPWFKKTITDDREEIAREIHKVLTEARDRIVRAGGKSPL